MRKSLSLSLLCACLCSFTLGCSSATKPDTSLPSASLTNSVINYTKDFDTKFKDATYPMVIELYDKSLNKDKESGITDPEILTDTDTLVKDVTKPMIYAFRAVKPNGYGVIILPGGGYYGVAMQHEGFDVANWFASKGISAFVLKYRMPNKVDNIPLDDVNATMDLIEQKAAEFALDPNKVGVFGASAGGHLAASYCAYAKREGSPAFAVLFYPAISFNQEIAKVISSRKNLVGPVPDGSELELKYSMEKHVTKDTAPTFITLAVDDTAVPPEHSMWYFQSLLDNDVNATMHIFPKGGHGFGFRENFPYHNELMVELEDWLEKEIVHQDI